MPRGIFLNGIPWMMWREKMFSLEKQIKSASQKADHICGGIKMNKKKNWIFNIDG